MRVGKQIVFLEIHDGGAIGVAYAVLHEYFAVESFVSVFVPEQSPAVFFQLLFGNDSGVVKKTQRPPHIRDHIVAHIVRFAVYLHFAEGFAYLFEDGLIDVAEVGERVGVFCRILRDELRLICKQSRAHKAFDGVFAGADEVDGGFSAHNLREHCFVGVESAVSDVQPPSRHFAVVIRKVVEQTRVDIVFPVVYDEGVGAAARKTAAGIVARGEQRRQSADADRRKRK